MRRQWSASFGAPQVQAQAASSVTPQGSTLSISPTSGTPELATLQDLQVVGGQMQASGVPAMTQQQFSAPAPVPSFVTSAMWQESVARVYEGGLKRAWDYDGGPIMNHR